MKRRSKWRKKAKVWNCIYFHMPSMIAFSMHIQVNLPYAFSHTLSLLLVKYKILFCLLHAPRSRYHITTDASVIHGIKHKVEFQRALLIAHCSRVLVSSEYIASLAAYLFYFSLFWHVYIWSSWHTVRHAHKKFNPFSCIELNISLHERNQNKN